MITEFLIGQLFLALFNVINVYIDAYRILANKTIAHAINFTAYLVWASLVALYLNMYAAAVVLFFLSAFFNRQFTFDVPLNERRGLAWYYQSTANPPKAILDRIERLIFGTGPTIGKKILKAYSICYCVTVIIWLWVI